jgi:hypothetical protein
MQIKPYAKQGSAIMLSTVKDLQVENIGTTAVLGGHITDDPVQSVVYNICAGLAGYGAVFLLGGGVLPLFGITTALGLSSVNDLIHCHKKERATLRSAEVTEPEDEADPPVPVPVTVVQAQTPEPVDAPKAPPPAPIPHGWTDAEAVKMLGFAPKAVAEAINIFDLSLVVPPTSIAIAAKSGCGKGLFVSNVVRTWCGNIAQMTVIGIDGKSDENEVGYWTRQVGYTTVFRLAVDTVKPAQIALWLTAALDAWDAAPAPKTLVVSELYALALNLKEYPDILGRLDRTIQNTASLGNSRRIFCIVDTVTPIKKEIGISLDNLRPVALIKGDEIGALNQLTVGRFVVAPAGGKDEVEAICKKSIVNRAIYYGGSWYEMGVLPNSSGFNRDEYKVVGVQATLSDVPLPTTLSESDELFRPKYLIETDLEATDPKKAAAIKRGAEVFRSLFPDGVSSMEVGALQQTEVLKARSKRDIINACMLMAEHLPSWFEFDERRLSVSAECIDGIGKFLVLKR